MCICAMPLNHHRLNTQQGGLPYIIGIDGLRALAVAAVLLYHTDIAWMQGGFLGVEAFFVISGFLITNLLCAEWDRNGRIQLARFWLRRARRLLPALFVMLAAVAAFVVLAVPDQAAALRGDTLAALAYVTNWWLIFRQQSYFEAMGRPPPLQHLWSLAVEEQFYLVWPLVCVAVFGACRPFTQHAAEDAPQAWLNGVQRSLLGIVALLVAGGSAWLMAAQFQPETDPSRVYYGSDTRLSGLLIGAALALLWAPWKHRRLNTHEADAQAFARLQQPTWLEQAISLLLDLIGLATLLTLAGAMVKFSEYDARLYQGGFLLISLLTAVLIFAVAHPAARLVPALLETAPLRWLGTRSYSVYLWHWPVIIFSRPQLDIALDGLPLFALRLALTFVLAELSFRLIEQPVRNGAIAIWWQYLRDRRTGQRLVALSTGIAAFALIAGVTGWLGVALARARPQPLPQELAAIADDANTALPIEAADNDQVAALPTSLPTIPPPATATVAATTAPTIAAAPTLLAATTAPTIAAAAPTLLAATAAPSPSSVPPTAVPTAAPTPVPPAPPNSAAHIFAIGDSVMVGAAKELQRALGDVEIDARVSRQAKQALAILQARHDAGQLGDEVIIHIGTNGPFSLERFEGMMAAVGDTRRVVVVNVKVPRRWEDANNSMLAAAAQRYPNVRFVDWRAASINRPELFVRDGIHLKPEGARLYASLIAQAVSEP